MSVAASMRSSDPGPGSAARCGFGTRSGSRPAAIMTMGTQRTEKDESESENENENERSPGLYKDDIFVSPVLERTPSWSGTRWTRFFPEISSHFSLVSPTSTHFNHSRHTSLDGITKSRSRHSSDSADISEPTTAPSSLWDELADDASSCYTRRSSITSLGSEPSASAYRSADAFSIISPTRAGVFDELSRSASRASLMSTSTPMSPSPRDKPLPCPPPIQMAPLSIRRKKKQPPTIREDRLSEIPEGTQAHGQPHEQTQKQKHHPTLSQAAEELENALAGLVEHKHIPAPSPPRIEVDLDIDVNAPLQVSRGNMDMMPSRPAPSPPVHLKNNRKSASSPSSSVEEIMKHAAKKPHKGRTSFSFPGFGMGRNLKSHRPHLSLRSLSSANIAAEQKHTQETKDENKENDAGSGDGHGLLSAPAPTQRPASVSSERELRLKLPRLRTKEVLVQEQPLPTLEPSHTIPAHDAQVEAEAVEVSQPKPRKTFSFEPEGAMSKNTDKPVGPYEMEVDSGPMVIYELDAGLPEHKTNPAPASIPFVAEGQMPGTLPDEIVAMVLRECNQLQDLFSFAVMNRQFYRVFKAHELELIKSTVFAMSPPAWELREMSPPWNSEWQVLFDLDAPVPEYTPSLYLDRYTRDLYTLVKLKSLILARCGSFLRPETKRGLAGLDDDRATDLDDAFWRVWTFCRIFGCGKGREGDVVGQLDWLRGGIMATSQQSSVTMSISEPFGMNNVLFEPPEGFGRGNHGGLSHSQLYDMTEIWTCLGVLLQPIHGRCAEARKAGVFNGHDAPEKDFTREEAVLEEWTSYILTLGPSAVLALGAIATVDNANEIFSRAQTLGLTKWESTDASRSIFFREAVSKAYKPRDSSTRRSPRLRQTSSNSSRSSGSSGNSSPSNSVNGKPHRRRQAAYAAQLRNRRAMNPDLSYVEERPISSYAEIMNRLAGAPAHPLYQQTQDPVPPIPASISSSTLPSHSHSTINTNASSTTLLPPPNLPPPISPPPQTQIPRLNTTNIPNPYMQARAPRPGRLPAQIRDPADQAIDMMVQELGFAEEDAKWALKITDTGEGINPNAAVSLLMQEYQRQRLQGGVGVGMGMGVPGAGAPGVGVEPRNSILSSVMHSQEALGSGWRWA